MDKNATILLVEDDLKLLNNNRLLLEREGYKVLPAENLAEARKQMVKEAPDLAVLDIRLPDGSGLDFLAALRRASTVPVLLLTSLGTDDDIIKGLEMGGNDYLSKPVTAGVFLARIRAALRNSASVPETLTKGALTLRFASSQALLNGVDMLLSQKEFALLSFFVQHERQTLTVETLYEKVWGQPMNDNSNAVKFQISRLRKKLEGSGHTISAEYGEGYRFEME